MFFQIESENSHIRDNKLRIDFMISSANILIHKVMMQQSNKSIELKINI